MEDYRARIGTLQSRIRAAHARLEQDDHTEEDRSRAARRIIDLAGELLELEDRLPVLLDEPRRRLSLRLVRASGALTAFLAGALVLTTVLGGLSRWWDLLLAPLTGVGAAVAVTRVRPAGAAHREQRTGACLIAAGTVVTGVTVLGVAPFWAFAVAAGALVTGMILVFGGPARLLSVPMANPETGEVPVVVGMGPVGSVGPVGSSGTSATVHWSAAWRRRGRPVWSPSRGKGRR